MKKKELAESSASSGAMFKEEIPKPMNVSGVVKTSKKDKKSVESAADPGATMMGRLASRVSSRQMIDSLNLGPKGTTTKQKEAQIADISSEKPPKKKTKKASDFKENEIPSRMFVGAGLHEQMKDIKSFNMSDPIKHAKK